jgi:phage terminase large subunit
MSDQPNRQRIELLWDQARFVDSEARFTLNSGGVGSGKTYSIILKVLDLIARHPGIIILIGARTFPQLRDTTMREFFNICPPSWISTHNKSNHNVLMHNGSEIFFRQLDDPNKLKSYTLGAAAIEEMSDVPEEFFKMLRTRMRQPNMPGCIFGATNPDVFGNWVYKRFIETPIEGSTVIYSNTARNVYLPDDFLKDLEELKKTNPDYYRRMVEGQWGAMEGLIYNLPVRSIREMPAYEDRDVWIPWHRTFDRFIAGLDFGFTHPTAMAIIGKKRELSFQVDEVYQRGLTSNEIVDIAKRKCREWRIDTVYCDSARPEIIEDLQRAGVPAVAANKDVFLGILYMKSRVNSGEYVVNSACTATIREFNSYIWDAKNKTKEVPIKANDDMMDALRYAEYSDKHNEGVDMAELLLGKY